MFQLFNIYHWIYILITIVLIIILDQIMQKMNKHKQYQFLFILSIINFVIHFVKVFIDKNSSLDSKIYGISLINLCAVNTVFYPLIFILKKKFLFYFFEFMGLFSGIFALLVCYDLNGSVAFEISNIRYWITHFLLLFISFELMRTKIVKFNYHSLLFCYICFFIEQGIIYLSDQLLIATKISDSISNQSFTYGIKDEFLGWLGFAYKLVPSIFYQDGSYLPVLWMLVPMLLVLFLAFVISILFFDRKHFVEDLKKFKGSLGK